MKNERAEETVGVLEEGLEEVRKIAGAKASTLLPEARPVRSIKRADYISRTYRTEEGPTIKQTVDGHLYEVSFHDGTKTFVLHHRTTGGNPFTDPALFGELLPHGGLDLRSWETFTYEWDGQATIKATEPNGRTTEVLGQTGVPEAMLPTLRPRLGHFKGEKTFGNIENNIV